MLSIPFTDTTSIQIDEPYKAASLGSSVAH